MSSLFVEYNMKGEKKKEGKFLRKKKKEYRKAIIEFQKGKKMQKGQK